MASNALETATYKLTPSGHNAPSKMRSYPKPDVRLAQAFETWLARLSAIYYDYGGDCHIEPAYHYAEALLDEFKPSLNEAHALLAEYQSHPYIHNAGIFISAIYNHIPEKEIVFDFSPVPFEEFGYKLPEDKVLINKADLGRSFGRSPEGVPKGVIVNFGKADMILGSTVLSYGNADFVKGSGWACDLTGKVINYGKCRQLETYNISINLGRYEKIGYSMYADFLFLDFSGKWLFDYAGRQRRVLNLRYGNRTKIPKLTKYFGSIEEEFRAGRNDWRAALAALANLGPDPRKKIHGDIRAMLGQDGYTVEYKEERPGFAAQGVLAKQS